MKAVFQVTTLENDWKPPFRKTRETKEFEVTEGDEFDRIVGNGNDEAVFQLLQTLGDRTRIRYSRLFTLKEPLEAGGREKTLTLSRGTQATLTYLWGEKGITKKITYEGISSGPEPEAVQESESTLEAEEVAEQAQNASETQEPANENPNGLGEGEQKEVPDEASEEPPPQEPNGN